MFAPLMKGHLDIINKQSFILSADDLFFLAAPSCFHLKMKEKAKSFLSLKANPKNKTSEKMNMHFNNWQ